MRWFLDNWITVVTLLISAGTLLILIYEIKVNKKQILLDRNIRVMINERRRMQIELMNHVTELLSIDRKVTIGRLKRKVMREWANDVQNHKINIWI